MEIVIIKGYHEGRTGVIVSEGTFNVFGKEVTGVKVAVPGLAGLIVLEAGDYVPAIPKDDTEPPSVLDRFTKGRVSL